MSSMCCQKTCLAAHMVVHHHVCIWLSCLAVGVQPVACLQWQVVKSVLSIFVLLMSHLCLHPILSKLQGACLPDCFTWRHVAASTSSYVSDREICLTCIHNNVWGRGCTATATCSHISHHLRLYVNAYGFVYMHIGTPKKIVTEFLHIEAGIYRSSRHMHIVLLPHVADTHIGHIWNLPLKIVSGCISLSLAPGMLASVLSCCCLGDSQWVRWCVGLLSF